MRLKDFGTLCFFGMALAVLSFSPAPIAADEEIADRGSRRGGGHHARHHDGHHSYRGGHGGNHGDWRRNTGLYYYNSGPYYNNGYYNNPYYDPYYYDDGVYYDNNSGLFFRFGF